MFTPFNNTLAVDFRPNDGGGIGLQSFVHEYGHFLDYNTKDELPRSLSSDFADVVNYPRMNSGAWWFVSLR